MTLANVTISSGTSNLAATAITNGTSNVTIASSGGAIAMATNGTTAITVDTSQNVGIGGTNDLVGLAVQTPSYTTAYAADLGGNSSVAGYGSQLQVVSPSDSSTVSGISLFSRLTARSRWDILNVWSASYLGSLVFRYRSGGSSTAEAMRIDSSGKLLVGTTTAGLKLTVQDGVTISSSDQSTCRLVLQNNTSPGRTFSLIAGTIGVGNENFSIYDNTAAATRMVIDNSGNFDFKSGLMTSTGTQNNTTGAGANMFISAGQMYRSTSSLKYKKNVKNATHGLVDLLKLRPVTYEGKAEADDGKTFGGLIAEEVHEAGLTEFVQYAEDGSPDALAYGNMVSLCVKSIQELKAINDTQAETINALTARIVALEAK
jgi:hypothetical protein